MTNTMAGQLLDLLAEDSYGLWEILWWYQERTTGSSAAEAKASLSLLLDQMATRKRIQASIVDAGGELPIPPDEFRKLLRETAAWEPKLPTERQVRCSSA
jgi:hypothetical protein